MLVANRPQGLRDMNEKVFTAWFPQCCAPTLITRDMADMHAFLREHQRIVCKPLYGMGGRSIFVIERGDKNANVVFETMTEYGTRFAIVQRYIPDIVSTGDSRILVIDGEPAPYALARIPQESDHRGNLAAGARGEGRELNERDRWLVSRDRPDVAATRDAVRRPRRDRRLRHRDQRDEPDRRARARQAVRRRHRRVVDGRHRETTSLMNAAAPETAPLPLEMREGVAPVKDRMTTTLFLAALFHGVVILGVTFAVPMLDKQPAASIEVLLVTGEDTRAADNLSAQYLAQRNQQGSGTTDEHVRPSNPASSAIPAQQAGIPDGNSSEYREAVSGKQSAEILSSRSELSEVEYRSGEDRPAQQAEAPLALSPTTPRPIATNATDETLRLRGKRADGTFETVPNTRESKLAPYIDAWRRKVERLGTLNFPQIARNGAGNPILEVSIRRDGSLGEALIKRSSGRKEIDQAALSILRLASPFDPFPQELSKQYSELRFAYEWQFLGGDVTRRLAGRRRLVTCVKCDLAHYPRRSIRANL